MIIWLVAGDVPYNLAQYNQEFVTQLEAGLRLEQPKSCPESM